MFDPNLPMAMRPRLLDGTDPNSAGSQGILAQAPMQELPPVNPAPTAAPVAPPAAMPQGFNQAYQDALAQSAMRFSPQAMAEREAAAMASLAEREKQTKLQQEELDKQRKWAGLMGFGTALQGGDPSRVLNPYLEKRQALANQLDEINTMRANLPQMLRDENMKGIVALGNAFSDYQRGVKAGQPDVVNPLQSQYLADRVAAAAELFPGVSPNELAARTDILLSPEVSAQYNRNVAARSGLVAKESAKGRREGAPPIRSGGGGGGGKAGKPNVSGMSAGDLLKSAGL